MSEMITIIVMAWVAGLAAVAGGAIAWGTGKQGGAGRSEITHGVTAMGGGILVAAVSFALLPPGMEVLSPIVLGAAFCGGGLLFCLLDAYLGKRGGTGSQFMAMMLDFLPEALALGAVFESDHRLGVLLALFIGAQNLPEGFNSFREIVSAGVKPVFVLLSLLAVSLLGPMAAYSGYVYLQDLPGLTAGIMAFASGGIMYLIFQDIAPQAKMTRHWIPTLGAVLGFAAGMLGKQVLG